MGIWKRLHRWVRSPVTLFASGIMMLVAGGWELYEVWEEFGAAAVATNLGGEHAVVLLGLVTVIVALEDLVYGTQSAVVGLVPGRPLGRRRSLRLVHSIVSSSWFQVVLGILVLVAGLAEGGASIFEAYDIDREQVEEGYWHLAVIGIGLVALLKGLAALNESMKFLSDENGEWRFSPMRRLRPILEHPSMEVALALAVVIFCVWEEIAGESESLGAHHGLLFQGLRSLVTAGPDLIFGVELVDEAHDDEERERRERAAVRASVPPA